MLQVRNWMQSKRKIMKIQRMKKTKRKQVNKHDHRKNHINQGGFVLEEGLTNGKKNRNVQNKV